MINRDSLDSKDSSSATVLRGGQQSEQLLVHGRYHARCVGPAPERATEYVALRDKIEALESLGIFGGAVPLLKARLAAIPLVEKWDAGWFDNTVTTLGKNDLLDKYLKGAAYTQTMVMGLKGTGTAVAADTQSSHASWNEVGLANAPTYTGNRQAVTFGSASAGVSTSPTQTFAITSTGTVAGCFMNNGGSATKDNTTGVLFSAGDFTGGSKSVSNGDSVLVVYSLSV